MFEKKAMYVAPLRLICNVLSFEASMNQLLLAISIQRYLHIGNLLQNDVPVEKDHCFYVVGLNDFNILQVERLQNHQST